LTAEPVAQPPAPRRRVPVYAWILGGCGVVLVLGAALAVVGFFIVAGNFQAGGLVDSVINQGLPAPFDIQISSDDQPAAG